MDWNYPNFTKEEVACKCGCGFLPKPEFMEKLQRLRNLYGKKMKITSAARCETHNAKVGGAPASKHVEGLAVDIACSSKDACDLFELAVEVGFWGRGVAKTFVHLDMRTYEERRVWQYGKD
jgi:zinc D-Ala-D-Ala carboxypeptidase